MPKYKWSSDHEKRRLKERAYHTPEELLGRQKAQSTLRSPMKEKQFKSSLQTAKDRRKKEDKLMKTLNEKLKGK